MIQTRIINNKFRLDYLHLFKSFNIDDKEILFDGNILLSLYKSNLDKSKYIVDLLNIYDNLSTPLSSPLKPKLPNTFISIDKIPPTLETYLNEVELVRLTIRNSFITKLTPKYDKLYSLYLKDSAELIGLINMIDCGIFEYPYVAMTTLSV